MLTKAKMDVLLREIIVALIAAILGESTCLADEYIQYNLNSIEIPVENLYCFKTEFVMDRGLDNLEKFNHYSNILTDTNDWLAPYPYGFGMTELYGHEVSIDDFKAEFDGFSLAEADKLARERIAEGLGSCDRYEYTLDMYYSVSHEQAREFRQWMLEGNELVKIGYIQLNYDDWNEMDDVYCLNYVFTFDGVDVYRPKMAYQNIDGMRAQPMYFECWVDREGITLAGGELLVYDEGAVFEEAMSLEETIKRYVERESEVYHPAPLEIIDARAEYVPVSKEYELTRTFLPVWALTVAEKLENGERGAVKEVRLDAMTGEPSRW